MRAIVTRNGIGIVHPEENGTGAHSAVQGRTLSSEGLEVQVVAGN